MENITLFSAKICPYAHRCRLALAESGLQHNVIDIDLRNKPDWYLQINPEGKVPTLRQGSFVITESLVINELINELAASRPLLPEQPQQKALARRFIFTVDNSLIPLFYRLLRAQSGEKLASASEQMRKALAQINRDLQNSPAPYVLGHQVTLADLAIYPWFERWPVLKHYRGLELSKELDALQKWLISMKQRESVLRHIGNTDYYITEYEDYASGRK